jgi:electron transfer flavoprotein beta subunit
MPKQIICLVKFVPNVDGYQYDYERNVLIRENVKMIINPDDAYALSLALQLQKNEPDTQVEIVSMGPLSVLPLVRDLLRRGVKRATLLSDKRFVGSDTYVTSRIIARYLSTISYDLIVSGSHSMDGDTAHVPAQIAELLQLEQMSNVKRVEIENNAEGYLFFEVESEGDRSRYRIELPALLSLSRDSPYKLPFVRYSDLKLEVDDRITIITNDQLGIPNEELGLKGSLTKVVETYPKTLEEKQRIVVTNDDEGIETVYQFLKERGFV